MALVRDDCLVPTVDDSALGYIKESSSQQFVPDVFYKVKIIRQENTFLNSLVFT